MALMGKTVLDHQCCFSWWDTAQCSPRRCKFKCLIWAGTWMLQDFRFPGNWLFWGPLFLCGRESSHVSHKSLACFWSAMGKASAWLDLGKSWMWGVGYSLWILLKKQLYFFIPAPLGQQKGQVISGCLKANWERFAPLFIFHRCEWQRHVLWYGRWSLFDAKLCIWVVLFTCPAMEHRKL